MTIALSRLPPTSDRCLPVDEAFATLLPDAGLPRGGVVRCAGPADVSLALGLVSRAVTAGSWLAVVGVPVLGLESADELGVPLSRVVRVDAGRGATAWAERVAAAADGFEVVMTRAPAGADRLVSKVRNRFRARGAVMIVVGPGITSDVELTTTEVSWSGLGVGHGSLAGRRLTVRAGGRRIPRPIERALWLPGPSGHVEPVDEPGVDRATGLDLAV